MSSDQRGRTAVVVGGAGGIGRACVRLLARDGWSVVIADVTEVTDIELDEPDLHGRVRFARFDLADRDSHVGFLDDLGSAPGALVVTAALLGPMVPMPEYSTEDWDRVVAVNLTGTFFLAQASANRMASGAGGRVVLFMSAAGRTPGKTTIIPYIATKAAIPPLIASFAYAYRGTNVLFTAVDPGRTLTEINRAAYPDPSAAVTPDLTMGRLLEPDEVAEVVSFLCSERANGVTGAVWGVSTRP